jgi:hypothetical protein
MNEAVLAFSVSNSHRCSARLVQYILFRCITETAYFSLTEGTLLHRGTDQFGYSITLIYSKIWEVFQNLNNTLT